MYKRYVAIPKTHPDAPCKRTKHDFSEAHKNAHATKPIIPRKEFNLMRQKKSAYSLRAVEGPKKRLEFKPFDLASNMKELNSLSL